MKVICNHAGGLECDGCKHNQEHEANLFPAERYGKTKMQGCTTHEAVCSCAINGGGESSVKCVKV